MSPLSRRARSTRSARPPGKGRVHASSPRRSGSERSALLVQETLASYARRGVFRAYGDQPSRNGQSRFSFRWHADATFQIVHDPRRGELIFRDVLPGIPARSRMYRELKTFVEGRSSRALPEHRRLDPRKARVTVTNRRGVVSLIVSLKAAHLEYGVRRAVNLIHELFVEFLRNPLYFSYMVEHFQLDPDL
jgi:hypothetical protein